MHDIIIIGAGPAGISASLYAKRSNLDVLILYHGKADLEKASQIDNYYGFEKGISGKDLYNAGIQQAKNLGVEIKEEEVLNIEQIEQNFKLTTTLGTYNAKSIIIATGNKKLKPNITGINEFEGKGISYCAICDGFFYRNKNICVIGNGNYAISEAKELEHIASKVTILSNGLETPNTSDFDIIDKKIKAIIGEDKVSAIEFEDGTKIETAGIFIALGEASGIDFAKKLGLITSGDNIKVSQDNMETNIKGIYACGNITGGLLQICKSVYEGATAGIQAAQYVRGINNEDNK